MTFGSMSYEENLHEIFPIGVYINSDAVLGNYQVEVSYDATRLRYVNGGTSAQEDLDMKADNIFSMKISLGYMECYML